MGFHGFPWGAALRSMAFVDDEAMALKLQEFLHVRIGRHLGRREQRESFALYAYGIVGEGAA